MFQKKFKIRVRYFAEDKYVVQYAFYRIFPMWYSLNFWFNGGLSSNLEGWSPKLFSVADAEKFAKSLNSISDVEDYYRKEKDEERNFYERKSKFHENSVPYRTKVFEKT